MGHGGPPCTPHNSLGPIFFEALDHTEQQYVMPTEIFWVPLPVGGHFQNGRRCFSKITFLSITLLLWQVEKWFWCLYPCFTVPGIQLIHSWSSSTFTFEHIWRKCQFMFKLTTSFPENNIFGHNSASLIGRDLILVSLPMFMGTSNTMSISLKL